MKRYFLLGLAILFLLTSFLTACATGKKIKYGFIDKTGKVVIEPQFDGIEEQFTGLAGAFNLGEPVFREGLAPVTIRGKWGYIDRTGNFVIKPQFFVVRPFSEGLAAVQPRNKRGWNYIDKTGNFLIVSGRGNVAANTTIAEAHSFSEGFAWIQANGTYCLIDKTPKIFLSPPLVIAEDVRDFREGMTAVKLTDGPWVYIGRAGETMFLPPYAVLGPFEGFFSEGMAVLRRTMDEKYGFIDKAYDAFKNDKFVIEPQFEDAYNFCEGLAPVKINGKWGYIDKTGKFAIKPQFDSAQPFSEGLAGVRIGQQWGYINKTGKFVVGPQFEFVSCFSDGMGRIVVGGRKGFVDKTGKIVIEPNFDYAQSFSEGLAAVGFK
jgi:WG containing repeat